MLLSSVALAQHAQNDLLLLGSFYGVMLTMLLYNALIFLAVRDRSHFDYLLFISFEGLLLPICLNGLGVQYLWGDSPRWTNISTPFSICVALIAIARFTQSFLQLQSNAPRLSKLMNAFQWTGLTGAVLALVADYSHSVRASIALATLEALVIPAVAVWLFAKGLRVARFFLIAFSVFLFTILIKVGQVTGIIATNLFTLYSLQFGMAFTVVVFSLALADKINLERTARERLERLKRFFSPEVATAILAEGGGALLETQRRDITAVFTDLRRFTEFASQAEPEAVLQVLRQYHEVVGRTVSDYQGTLEHFAGDGVMIYFNAPVRIGDPEARAVRMAIDLKRQFETLCAGWKQCGYDLGIGIGIASGYATIGAVGWEGRQDYAAIGTVTNLASRLCSRAMHGQILASERLMSKLNGMAVTEDLGEQELKGMPKPMRVYNLVKLNS